MLILVYLAAISSIGTATAIPAALNPRNIDAMVADNTCRWTNCNQNCSPGFVSVARSGGARGEMMWDHTYCDRGLSRFCCPANVPQPVCTWRGHSNSGRCKPACQIGEAEVWTIKLGCKSGHQSACCKTDTPSMQAYAHCRWEGAAPNCWGSSQFEPNPVCSTPLFSQAAVKAPAGFGGADTCSKGSMTYCCRHPDFQNFLPPAFSQCFWSKDIFAGPHNPMACNADCPENHIKLAVHPRNCAKSGGYEALCCRGYKPSDLPEHQPPDVPTAPKKSEKVLQFELAVDR
ncbi:hypothetical protein FB567DRAFT_191319 [Paraphoma chrysanthemicola]|uniref:Uncharacterized protein n=1 Tax=Paraphoma chrysanthemicola TaxID=798071 RepID=A0A8K0QXY8_9PLEO|nr:hypothetical protein FB567DRAFT_191319 [Paraphoma chrysanthemicola]